jgi:6-phosphogluconolactonase
MIEKINIYQTPEELADMFADRLINLIVNNSGREYHLAISGGKTPDLLFSALTKKYVQSPLWQKIHFWWVDERMVPPDHPESNYRVANNLLLSKIPVPKENIHRIKGENKPEEEALSYSAQIRKKLPTGNGWPVFDMILLGMGDDGHTASIFPDQMQLLESDQICAVATHPVSGQKRVTLTGKAINNAAKISFLVTGSGKAERLKEIGNYPEMARLLPAFHILNAEWFVDKAAANLPG